MKFGVSSYSLSRAITAGEMTVLDVIDWIAGEGGEHIEIVPVGFDLTKDQALTGQIRQKAASAGIDVSNYAIGASFLQEDPAEVKAEIERVKRHVDIAAELGVRLMRHDVAQKRPPADLSLSTYEADLPRLIEACQEIADYAKPYGITTSVENHGYYIQSSERVYRLVKGVGRDNFRTTVDIGNFLCADEDPVVAVKRNLEIASIIHLKDFYRRRPAVDLGEGWIHTPGGYYLRGAIFGHGDVDCYEIMGMIHESGYEGYLSLEFEGWEECRRGTSTGFKLVRQIWEQTK